MKYIAIILTITIGLIACDSSSKKEATVSKEKSKTKEIVAQDTIPTLPISIIEDIALNADYLDVLFETLNFSMSQDDNKNIRSFLRNIDLKTPLTRIEPNCEVFGSVAFNKKGNTIIEGDIYYSKDCKYFIFLDENRKPKYANKMSGYGIEFFNRLIKGQFKTSKK